MIALSKSSFSGNNTTKSVTQAKNFVPDAFTF
jgi:hypothetical protein